MRILSMIVFVAMSPIMWAQSNINDNGWNNYTWGMSKQEAEAVSKTLTSDTLWLTYEVDNYRVSLDFDEDDLLNTIVRYCDFHMMDSKKANGAFMNIKRKMFALYGTPDKTEHDTANEVRMFTWNLPNMNIGMKYDYKLKFVDELGCCSYTITVTYLDNH